MQAVIDGKRYNTETATELAYYWNNLSRSDFRFVSETLFKTKKGAYFLAGEGGALSNYAQLCGDDSTCGGSARCLCY